MSAGWADLALIVAADDVPARVAGGRASPVLDQLDAVVAARTSGDTPANPRGLPAVIGAQRLIATTIDQLNITVSRGPVPTWLRRPRRFGSHFDQGDLVQWLVSCMFWRGTGYLACTRVGESWRLDAVHPDYVQPIPTVGPVVDVTYRLGGEPAALVPASPDDAVQGRRYLLPIPFMVTDQDPAGVSPLQLARRSLEGFSRTEDQSWSTMDDGTHSGGRLETEQDLAPVTAQRYQERWVEARRGRRIPVLGSGLRYTNDLINPRDAQWIEARAFNQAVTYMLLGIPPAYMGASLVGGQSSLSYSNAQDNNQLFRRNCLEGFTSQIEDALSTLMPPGRGEDESIDVMFDYTEWEGQTSADE